MALTRPTSAQIDSSTEVITDPISLLNNKSNRANVDVGFLFNRDGGISSNVAVFWQESSQRFVFALTSSNAVSRFSNIAVISNANVVAGNVFAAGYFYSNGAAFSGGSSYSNVQVATYLPTYTGVVTASNVAVDGNVTATQLFGNSITATANLTVDTINANTKIMIGSASSGLGFHLRNAAAGNQAKIETTSNQNNFQVVSTAATVALGTWNNLSKAYVGTPNAHKFSLMANNTEYVFLEITGNVGIGNSSPLHRLSVAGNVYTSGDVITTGYFIGNGSQLTGITIDATRIENGTSNVQAYSSSDIAVSVGGTANIARFTTDGITMRTGSEIRGHNVRATNGLLTNTINATSGSNISLSTIYNFSSVNNIWAANAYITTDVSVGRNLTVTGEINTSKTVTALNILNPFLLAGM